MVWGLKLGGAGLEAGAPVKRLMQLFRTSKGVERLEKGFEGEADNTFLFI